MISRGMILWLVVVGAAGYAMYQIKYEVVALEERLAARQAEVMATQESIHVLRAEWAYLNEPRRIAALAERHLDLTPIGSEHLVSFDAFDRARAVRHAVLTGEGE